MDRHTHQASKSHALSLRVPSACMAPSLSLPEKLLLIIQGTSQMSCPLKSFLESPRTDGTIHFLIIINRASMLIFRDMKSKMTGDCQFCNGRNVLIITCCVLVLPRSYVIEQAGHRNRWLGRRKGHKMGTDK